METEITIEKDIIMFTTKTAEFLLSDNPDSMSLYVFYIKNAKIQKTNQIWNTDTFGMTGLGWGKKRYTDAKKVLLDSGLLTLIQTRDSKGRLNKTFLKLNYIHKHQNTHVDETTAGKQETNALSNKKEMLKVIKINALEPDENQSQAPVEELPKQESNLPDILGKNKLTRLVKLYNILWADKFGRFPTETPFNKYAGLLKPIMSAYTEYQIASLLAIHFSWHGTSGTDDFVYKNMSNNGFSLTLFRKNVDLYIAYLTNVLHVEYTSDEQIRRYVKNTLGVKVAKYAK